MTTAEWIDTVAITIRDTRCILEGMEAIVIAVGDTVDIEGLVVIEDMVRTVAIVTGSSDR